MLERYSDIRVVAKRRALEEMRNVANGDEADSTERDNGKGKIALGFEDFYKWLLQFPLRSAWNCDFLGLSLPFKY